MTKKVEGQEDQKTEEKQFTETELKAMDAGWVPEDEWTGEKDAWRPAKEFLDRGELFKKIDDQNRTVKELRKALEEMKQHHSSVRETEYKRALETLKAERKDALAAGDADQVVEIEDQIDLIKEEQQKLKQAPKSQEDTPQLNPEFVAWVDKNRWYETNEPMRAYADALGRSLTLRGYSPSQVLEEVSKQVKTEFPQKFRNSNRDKPGTVEGSSAKGGKNDTFVLTDDERRIMNRFVRNNVITEEQYIADLKKMREQS